MADLGSELRPRAGAIPRNRPAGTVTSVGTAQTILGKVGLNQSAFPTEKHFVSWLRRAARGYLGRSGAAEEEGHRDGANRVAVLRMGAVSLQHSHSALGAAHRRTVRRKGYSVAIFSLARKLAVLIYRMMRHGQDYLDCGEAEYEARFDRRNAIPMYNQCHGDTDIKRCDHDSALAFHQGTEIRTRRTTLFAGAGAQ